LKEELTMPFRYSALLRRQVVPSPVGNESQDVIVKQEISAYCILLQRRIVSVVMNVQLGILKMLSF
jgi:hypothetical protein